MFALTIIGLVLLGLGLIVAAFFAISRMNVGMAIMATILVLILFVLLAWPGWARPILWPAGETAAETTLAPDLCADQVNPAWGNLIARNSLQQSVYEAWLVDVTANGGAVYGASKCSLPVDSRVFGPTDLVKGSGPAQLVTDYRFSGIWHPSVDASYSLASGCTFEPQFSQGDAPVAVYRAPGTVRLTNNVSNGVSLVGQVTCP